MRRSTFRAVHAWALLALAIASGGVPARVREPTAQEATEVWAPAPRIVVLIQNDFELEGETVYVGWPRYEAHGAAPIKLQAHGDPSPPISFRNIWVRDLR